MQYIQITTPLDIPIHVNTVQASVGLPSSIVKRAARKMGLPDIMTIPQRNSLVEHLKSLRIIRPPLETLMSIPKSKNGKKGMFCPKCKKIYYSKGSLDNHIKSCKK